MDDSIAEKVAKIEERVEKLEEKFNKAIPEIQTGINEIKVMLQERPIQETLRNTILENEIKALKEKHNSELETLDKRVKKTEDNLSWIWKTIAGVIITAIVGLILV